MITVKWTFTKDYTKKEFEKLFPESNDVLCEGYFVIANDRALAGGVDDLHLDYETLDDNDFPYGNYGYEELELDEVSKE